MLWIDYAIIGIISFSFIIGMLRGFRLEIFSLVFWVLATFVGLSFSIEFSVFLESTIGFFLPKIIASFALLFVITLIVGGLIRMLLGETINKNDLTYMDYLGGMIFGAAHGMFAVIVLVLLAGLTHLPDDPWWKESKLLPPFQIAAIWLRDHIPSGMTGYIHYR